MFTPLAHSEPVSFGEDANQMSKSSSSSPLPATKIDTTNLSPSCIGWDPSYQENSQNGSSSVVERLNSDQTTSSGHRLWKFHMRGYDDEEPTDWWFASTAVPLLAATLAPLANMLSIAALVTKWRMSLTDPKNTGAILDEFEGITFADPKWCYWINVGSLICGFVGNIFLLFNFTGRIRYIVALPMTIILWYFATGMLTAIILAMNVYVPPHRPWETYSQGFWYAVLAAVLYCICSGLLMVNMLGYFLGHYTQRFNLNDHQRTLILQTMMFFIWMAGGGAMFSSIESKKGEVQDWAFVDGLYFCDVTILTIGYGDLTLHSDLGRGLVFPYSVGGIVILGLVISSISKFAVEISEDNVVKKHADRIRTRTLELTTNDPRVVERHEILKTFSHIHPTISRPFNPRNSRGIVTRNESHRHKHKHREERPRSRSSHRSSQRRASLIPPVHKRIVPREAIKLRHKKIRLLKDERDRFDEMRRIEEATRRFKRWWALVVSVCAFAVLWCVGAVVFWLTERRVQNMSYFQALYFCYVSLLTIGYGDFAPKSNAGRPFFVVWSLIAVPTMTILISDMSNTVIESFKHGTFVAADFTLLLKKGIWADYFSRHPFLLNWIIRRREKKAREKRIATGMPYGDEPNDMLPIEPAMSTDSRAKKLGLRTPLHGLAHEIEQDYRKPPPARKLARRLAVAIRKVAADLKGDQDKKYSFEEWAEITRLIRFTTEPPEQAVEEEEEDPINWDWLGEKSPLMSSQTEAEFVLDRLCESLVRYINRVEEKDEAEKKESSNSQETSSTPSG